MEANATHVIEILANKLAETEKQLAISQAINLAYQNQNKDQDEPVEN